MMHHLFQWLPKLVLCCVLFTGNSTYARGNPTECPGYNAHDVTVDEFGISATLTLAGPACNAYGKDVEKLAFTVQHITVRRRGDHGRESGHAGETIFNTSGSSFVFESQYWRLRTSLPEDPKLYGLGEHTDPLRLNTTKYVRTLWNRDAGAVPEGTNLYGAHPVYFENRQSAVHGVALMNSNGMDVRIDRTPESGQYLEYNVIGGIPDFYFMAGSDPFEVARQYSEISGKAAMIPYWGLGFHQCRYGYQNVFEVAEVVYNYSKADIPLETMWTDIDYMDRFKIFTLDPANYPLSKMQELVAHLHHHQQHYIVMVDPAIAIQDYPAFEEAVQRRLLMHYSNGTLFRGVVWPGKTAFPDWFHPDTQDYWTEHMLGFFHPDHGVDIDGLWIDMNEPANFCPWPCRDPDGFLKGPGNWIDPPPPEPIPYNPRPLPGWPDDFQPPDDISSLKPAEPVEQSHTGTYKQATQSPLQHTEQTIHERADHSSRKHKGLPGRDLLDLPYKIHHADGAISNHGMDTDLPHAHGFVEYDVHNLYGLMMSQASRTAMLARRPHLRPLIVTRSTFLSAGRVVAHWLGDNVSSWEQYRISIRHMLQFTAFFQIPVVGADVCGFIDNTTAPLCARWTRLGAFYPFFRNHNSLGNVPQEFYRWEVTAAAARKGIDLRYRLLDYIYTALHRQTVDGTPMLFPLWMAYPGDPKTADIELQFFYGPALMVCPVVEEGSTEVSVYLPDELFYDFETGRPVRGKEEEPIVVRDVGYTEIPLFVRSGHIVPLRVSGANTTTTLRTLDFELLVAPRRGSEGIEASGHLYLDDGVSLEQQGTSEVTFTLVDDELVMYGKFDFEVEGVKVARAKILDPDGAPARIVELDWDLKGHKKVTLDEAAHEIPKIGDDMEYGSAQMRHAQEGIGAKSEL